LLINRATICQLSGTTTIRAASALLHVLDGCPANAVWINLGIAQGKEIPHDPNPTEGVH